MSQAHREYKEAISKGHGAYLMDEETPDVFTVSVGNIPPGAHVVIKITYVAELAVEGGDVVFTLPGSVAAASRERALDTVTQAEHDTVAVDASSSKMPGGFSIEVGVNVGSVIHSIRSTTHRILTKRTDTMATVSLAPGQIGMGSEGFRLLLGLAEIHRPRMWVEENEAGHHACMLTFYPEFDTDHV